MVSTTKQTMHPSPFLLTCFYAPGNWRSCAKMWHRLFWPKDTDWSCSNSTLGVIVCVHLCPYTTGASLGETDSIMMWTWNRTMLFQKVQWDRKWKQRVFLVTFSLPDDFADSEIYSSACVHWSSLYWLQYSSVSLCQQRCDLLLACNL